MWWVVEQRRAWLGGTVEAAIVELKLANSRTAAINHL